jgi:hypothetical protein
MSSSGSWSGTGGRFRGRFGGFVARGADVEGDEP